MERVTILTGAGLTAGVDFFDITTLKLTEAVIGYNHPELSAEKDPIYFLYAEYCKSNKLDPTDIQKNLGKINFETILQLIEELYSYAEDAERTHHGFKFQNSVKNTAFRLNQDMQDYLDKIRIFKGRHPFFTFIEQMHNHLIDLITKTLTNPNNDAANKGMNQFSRFIDSNFSKANYRRRIYTLNYDNWLHSFGNYFDGFTKSFFDTKK